MESRKRKLDTSPDIVEVDAKKKIQDSNDDEDIIVLNDENDAVEIKESTSPGSDKPPCEYGSNC